MSHVGGVGQVASRQVSAQQQQQWQKSLFHTSTFEKGGSVQGANGQSYKLPATDQEAQQALHEALEQMDAKDREKVFQGAADFTAMLQKLNEDATPVSAPPPEDTSSVGSVGSSSSNARAVSSSTSGGSGSSSSNAVGSSSSNAVGSSSSNVTPEQMQQASEQYFNQQKAQGSSDEAIMNSLKVSYQNATDTVYDIATELQAINDMKSEVGEDISELNVIISDGTYPVSMEYYNVDTGKMDTKTLSSKEAAEAFKEELETARETLGNDAQLTQLELQTALEQQAQALQMMSNIMKLMHDTAMSIINNMK